MNLYILKREKISVLYKEYRGTNLEADTPSRVTVV